MLDALPSIYPFVSDVVLRLHCRWAPSCGLQSGRGVLVRDSRCRRGAARHGSRGVRLSLAGKRTMLLSQGFHPARARERLGLPFVCRRAAVPCACFADPQLGVTAECGVYAVSRLWQRLARCVLRCCLKEFCRPPGPVVL